MTIKRCKPVAEDADAESRRSRGVTLCGCVTWGASEADCDRLRQVHCPPCSSDSSAGSKRGARITSV